MENNYLGHLIDLRYSTDHISTFSVAKVFKLIGLCHNTDKTDSSNQLSTTNAIEPLEGDTSSKNQEKKNKLTNKQACLQIQTNLQKSEEELYKNSPDYRELVKLQNCWKRINNELNGRATAQREKREEKRRDSTSNKRSRSDSSQELSEWKKEKGVDTSQELSGLKEKGVDTSQELSELKEKGVDTSQELSGLKEKGVDTSQELSGLKEKGVDTSQELSGLKEVEVSQYATHNQTIVEQNKMLQQMLHQILDNQKLQNDFLKNDCKLDQVYNSVQKAIDNGTSALTTNNSQLYKDADYGERLGFNDSNVPRPKETFHAGQHSKIDEEELYKAYGVGAALLSRKGGGGGLPKSLGRSEQGISSPIRLRCIREAGDRSGVGVEFSDPSCSKSIDFQSAHQITESSSSTSSAENSCKTPFGEICFIIRDNCQCIYNFVYNKDCDTYFGSYGIVVCPHQHPYAYKLVFCQDNGNDFAHVLVNNRNKELRRSSFKDAIYERRICEKLKNNETLNRYCILMNGKFNLK